MENATDALKIAFAVFVFVLAMAVIFVYISMAKSTADNVLYYADETNYYAYATSKEKNRIVNVAEVISTLHRYYKESLCVTVDLSSIGKGTKTFDLTNNGDNGIDKIIIQTQLKRYIEDTLLENTNEDSKFIEKFVDAPCSGTYVIGEDGTSLATQPGGNKLYVEYKLQKK